MSENRARQIFYERLGIPLNDSSLSRRRRDVLFDTKWKKFLRYVKYFRYIPFADFAFAAGSMALGNVHPSSDFDAIVGTRFGRIFTARFFCILAFALLGVRKKKMTHHDDAADKVCLNHFVTEESLVLNPPYNLYWQELYSNLVPLYGNEASLAKFWEANNWVGNRSRSLHDDVRYCYRDASVSKQFLETILSGFWGKKIESFLRFIQIRRIERNIKNGLLGYAPRIRYSDEELEFHPDTLRIDKLIADIYISQK